ARASRRRRARRSSGARPRSARPACTMLPARGESRGSMTPSWPPTPADVARLLEALALAEARSPHYRAHFAAARVRAAELRDYDAVRARVPRTAKADLVAAQRGLPPFGDFLAALPWELAAVHVSPGPLYIPRLADEPGGTPVLLEAIGAMGVRRGEVAHVTLSYHVMPGGLRLHLETGEPVRPGGTGELVATHLGRRALPLVRYAPGDVYRLREGACTCGNPAPRVDFVGQIGTIRKVRGVLVHAAQVAGVVAEF